MLQVKQFRCADHFVLIIFKSGGQSLQVNSCCEFFSYLVWGRSAHTQVVVSH